MPSSASPSVDLLGVRGAASPGCLAPQHTDPDRAEHPAARRPRRIRVGGRGGPTGFGRPIPEGRSGVTWVRRGLIILVLGVVLYLLVPRLGGLHRVLIALRGANPWLMAAGVVLEAGSLLAYALLYRTILAAEGSAVPLLPVSEVPLASFLVSHLVPGGSAAGTVVNVRVMRDRGVPPSTTGL